MKTYLLKKTNKIISVTLVLIGILYLYLGRNLRFGSWASPKNRLYATSSRSGNGFSFSHKRNCRIT